jgi:MFS family permease
VLIIAVHNSVDRRDLGVATAVTGFFRALGGAVGAAVLGAVFAAQAGGGVVDGVQAVFLVAAPLALLALLAVVLLPETPLDTRA